MQYSNQNTFTLRINEKCQPYHENPLISKVCILRLINIPCGACQKLHSYIVCTLKELTSASSLVLHLREDPFGKRVEISQHNTKEKEKLKV